MAPVSTTYHVTAKPWKGGWELHIDGVGVTQVVNLSRAEQQVRDYIETDLEVDVSNAAIVIDYDLGGIEREVAGAKKAVVDATIAQKNAAIRSRAVVRKMRDRGIKQSDIAAVVGVSKGRVSQLMDQGASKRSGKDRGGRGIKA